MNDRFAVAMFLFTAIVSTACVSAPKHQDAGPAVTINVHDMPVHEVLNELARQSGKILAIQEESPALSKTVSLNLKAPLEEFLQYLCPPVGADCKVQGEIIMVTPRRARSGSKH